MADKLKPSPEAVLQPCPFCGGEAELISRASSRVQCKNFQCIIGDPAPFNDFSHKADAITAWNTRALRPATMPGDVVERPAVAANMVEAVERALLMPGVLENPDARQRINAIALAQALTAMQPAIQAAVDALETMVEAFGSSEPGEMDRRLALLDASKALATLRTVTEQGEG